MAAPNNEDVVLSSQPTPTPGPFLARVVSHQDGTYMGSLEVELLRPVGNTASEGQLHQVKYMSPFYGVTGVDYVGSDPDDHNNTQKSYGMWMIPPDVGTTVVVIFIDGDPKRGYWIGCVQDENMNFMVPGLAATNYITNIPDGFEPTTRAPVSEYNKKINDTSTDPSKIKKPYHPLSYALFYNGLLYDDIRGITTSSARRETPSSVFGVSTPGPIDKQQNAKQGPIGKAEHRVPNGYVSRLGGTTFVMDDGDDKFLRKKSPYIGTDPTKAGGPDYASVEQGETDGDVTIPHNELVRIRTRTGHQILLHNSEDLIYIGNSKGTTWIELTSNGKIDIYAQDSISVHSENDINFTAKRDINFHAVEGNINLTSKLNFNCYAGMNYEIKAAGDGKLTVAGSTNIKSGGNHVETAAQIHMNGPSAASAGDGYVPGRIPQHEPWKEHENLDPTAFTADKTVAVVRTTGKTEVTPDLYKKYTTKTDTFAKIKGAEQQ